ncbi:MAG: hypothetical protein IPJ98_00005 [Bryobacterales bacterium]|nr:hypothetical protein [Bryobacterales bacterium]
MILAYWLYPEGYAACLTARKLGVPIVVGSRGTDLRRTPSPPEVSAKCLHRQRGPHRE